MPHSHNHHRLLTAFAPICAALLIGCRSHNGLLQPSEPSNITDHQFEATGEDFLISALDEVQAITDWAETNRHTLPKSLAIALNAGPRMILAKTATDTVYIYGQIISGGYGAIITERFAHPKGILLITVRRTYGRGDGHVVTETRRYTSYANHLNDRPQQTNVTELYGTQTDTIVTHVVRDGRLQTYTFRLPVITRVIDPQDGSVRVTSRYASAGQIISRTVEGNGNLVHLRRTYGQSDGSTVTRTEFPDGSWRQTRTKGEADKSIMRETTSGLPTIGSGVTVTPRPPQPINPIRPPSALATIIHQFSLPSWIPRSEWSLTSEVEAAPPPPSPLLASGVSSLPPVPKPYGPIRPQRGIERMGFEKTLASDQSMPPPPPSPRFTQG